MDRQDFYIYMTSSQSDHIYTNNSAVDFTVDLPQTLHLHGDWHVALVKFSFNENKGVGAKYFYVCSDISEVSLAANVLLPVLGEHWTTERKTTKRIDMKCTPLKYNRVRNGQQVSQIRMYIRPMQTSISSLIEGEVTCLLHLKGPELYSQQF